ncbi:MAG: cytochrome b [Paracoccaceae bacterium]
MPNPTNQSQGYDATLRALHWLMALLIATAAGIGLWMTELPMQDEADFATAMQVFSVHKTIGIAAFLLALLRIAWALTRPPPGPLHPERKAETLLAALTHWSLYGAMLVMPLSGWLYSSANPGYAPIFWPFLQSLPFVPADEALGKVFQTVHVTSSYVLYGAAALHVLGAFKHALIDRDGTLARMTTGRGPSVPPVTRHLLPALLALVLWAATIGAGIATAPKPEPDPFAEFGEGADSLEEVPAP